HSPPSPISRSFPYTTLFRSRDGDTGVHRVRGLRDEVGVLDRIIPARHAQKTQVMHRVVDGIRPEKGDPEVEFAQRVVQHSPGDLDRKSTRLNSSHDQISYSV